MRGHKWIVAALLVDGLRAGVIEVFHGDRPFFAPRGASRNVAMVRRGSSTDSATPDEIGGWIERDRNLHVQRLHAEKLESERILVPRLAPSERTIFDQDRWDRGALELVDQIRDVHVWVESDAVTSPQRLAFWNS